MRARHELATVAHSMFLELVPSDGERRLLTVVDLLDARVLQERAQDQSFDFAFWARGTLLEVVAFLAGCGLLVLRGVTTDDLKDLDTWPRASVQRTSRGDDFLELTKVARAELLSTTRDSRPLTAIA
jgi:hypothetical protein